MSTVKVIYILWIRQLKRYIRSPARMIGGLGQPTLFLVALGFGLGPVFQKAGGIDYFQFLVPGIIAMSILFTAVFSGIEIIWDKQFGFLKETLVAPVPRTTIMLGRTLGGATVALLQGLIVLLLATLFGFRFDIMMLPLAVLFMALIAILFTALGTAIGSVLEDMQGFQLIMSFLLMPMFFLSSALFPLDGVPAVLKAVAQVNPLSYGIDGVRSALINTSTFGIGIDLAVLLLLSTILIIIGGMMFSKIEV